MTCQIADIQIHDEYKDAVTKIKKGERYKYLLLNIRDASSIHVIDFGEMHDCLDRLVSNLQTNRCHYILYYNDQPPRRGDLVFIAWIPKQMQNAEGELYQKALMIVMTILGADHLRIVDEEIANVKTFQELIRQTLACSTNTNLLRIPELTHPIDNEGLGCLYYKSMVKNKAKIAQIEGLTGKTTTFGELLQSSVRLAINMKEKKVGRGDVVVICSNDNNVVALPTYATLFLGATVCALDIALGFNEIVNSLKQITPKMMFVESEALDKFKKALEVVRMNCELIVLGSTDIYTPFADLVQPVTGEKDFRPVAVKSLLDTAYIVFTSGSTGMPKTMCHNHHALQYQLFNFISTQFCWDLVLHYATPYWTLYTKFLGMGTILGTARLIYPTFYDNYWHFCKYNPTYIFFSVTEISTLCTYERPKHADFRGLKIMVGGNVMNNDHLKKIEKVFYDAEIYLSYGMTEIPCGLTTFKPRTKLDRDLRAKYPTSVGPGIFGLTYKIVDPETEEILGPNQKGELRIKTPFPLSGYYKVQPTPLWDSYGWLKSGDLAYYNEEQCIYIVDRIKNMFKYKDYHIVPSVLERALESHPSVRKAAVIGLPDEENGHLPLGVVILKSTQESVTGTILQNFVNEKVADYEKLRGGVKIIEKFPTTSTGKIRKWLLQDMIINTI